MMTPDRDLAKAIALGDLDGAAHALDMMVREEVVPDEHNVQIGRSDAAIVKRREARSTFLRKAA